MFQKDTSSGLTPLIEIEDGLISQLCVVRYDDQAYPGVIEDVDEDSVQVRAMHSSEANHFYWPMIEDLCWYRKEHVVTLLQKPMQQLTKRLMKLDDDIWKSIQHALDI